MDQTEDIDSIEGPFSETFWRLSENKTNSSYKRNQQIFIELTPCSSCLCGCGCCQGEGNFLMWTECNSLSWGFISRRFGHSYPQGKWHRGRRSPSKQLQIKRLSNQLENTSLCIEILLALGKFTNYCYCLQEDAPFQIKRHGNPEGSLMHDWVPLIGRGWAPREPSLMCHWLLVLIHAWN